MKPIKIEAWAVVFTPKEAEIMGVMKPEDFIVGIESNDNLARQFIYADLAFFVDKRSAQIHKGKVKGWKLQKVKVTVTPLNN